MNSELQKRLSYVDSAKASRLLEYFAGRVEKVSALVASEPERLLQTRLNSLGGASESRALQAYALGCPLPVVRRYLKEAVKAYEPVFRLRGTDPAFPAVVLNVNPTVPSTDPSSARVESIKPPNSKDFSLGNSQKCYHVACLALIAGDFEAAKRVGLMAWDPTGASYVGAGSFCTVNDQRFAYALRDAFANNTEAAVNFLSRVSSTPTDHNDVVDEAAMLTAILKADAPSFLGSLARLLEWHGRVAAKEPSWNQNYFLCASGLGLAALALRRGLIQTPDLPRGNPHLPVEFLAAELAEDIEPVGL